MMWPVNAMPVLLTAIILIGAASTTEGNTTLEISRIEGVYCSSIVSGGVAVLTKRNSHEETEHFDFNPLIELLRGQNGQDGKEGRDGRDGLPGPPGPPGPSSGGLVYTRWGRTICPDTPGTELVYAGRAGGSRFNALGGAANYLCLPENPDYLQYQAGVQGYSPVYGAEYHTVGESPLKSVLEHDAPCAMCFTSARVTVLMIPAKTQCPPSWTLEYTGYLMADHINHQGRKMFECIDKDPECVPGSAANTNPALFYHTEATCNALPCPPYDPEKELTCVVCTK